LADHPAERARGPTLSGDAGGGGVVHAFHLEMPRALGHPANEIVVADEPWPGFYDQVTACNIKLRTLEEVVVLTRSLSVHTSRHSLLQCAYISGT
jgi:hypothetical protein